MIIVLRVVGVAFEINGSWLAFANNKKEDGESKAPKDVKDKDPEFTEIVNPSLIDLFHYSFCYMGLLTGKLNHHQSLLSH